MAKSVRINGPTFTLNSTWTCSEQEKNKTVNEVVNGAINKTTQKTKGWYINGAPSAASKEVKLAYSFSSGSKILSAKIVVKVKTSNGGVGALTANGDNMKSQGGGVYSSDVRLSSTSTVGFPVVFKFRANGVRYADTSVHSCKATFEQVYLQIEYEGSVVSSKDVSGPSANQGLSVPPQSVCIYDKADNSIYMFDGVIKVQHTLSVDLAEEPEPKKKDYYVNNAFNEPDKLVLEVLMSDVYSGGGSIIANAGTLSNDQRAAFNVTKTCLKARDQNSWTRSELAYYTLHWLKEQRRKLIVITPQFIYLDMIIASVTVNHEDTTPFGWEGQIGFQHAFQEIVKKNKKKKEETTGGDGDGTPNPAGVAGGFWDTVLDNAKKLMGGS